MYVPPACAPTPQWPESHGLPGQSTRDPYNAATGHLELSMPTSLPSSTGTPPSLTLSTDTIRQSSLPPFRHASLAEPRSPIGSLTAYRP